jgi:alpha-glucuronidase
MSPNINLRVNINFLMVLLPVTCHNVNSSYRLLLKYELISNLLLLKHYRSSITKLKSEGSFEHLSVAKMELLNGMKGLIGKALQMYKPVNYNDCICYEPQATFC